MRRSTSLLSAAFLAWVTGLSGAIPAGIASRVAQTPPPRSASAWLDENTPNWNQPGAAIPAAPQPEGGGNLEYCERTFRQATLPEDALVEAAGWTLTGAVQIFNDTTIITGMASADGMCRPLSYQVFVFSKGAFVGTISPNVMDSRTDGSVFSVDLYQPDELSARFNRYEPEDALCCASAESRLFYEIETEGETAVLVPNLPATTFSSPDAQ
ncbi:LppP/LprE family lipoprotein [Thermoleptolyngbya sp. C42_A2020_037]|uniref:LppP/LprE family lipoprotein n=1 Tax=Thermoleptolyngbya sp. C42_A2020_037 TaxID=2747799 RepID=UPI0019E41A6C|nr:LppP/LprE family lipoprotein [Thermoleptolyngbya sp. C42_A2020_037]MBF2086012.1 LppP/LprE family lipoprotein [Thermoleptolyngbya sp. C42_A2020_037]